MNGRPVRQRLSSIHACDAPCGCRVTRNTATLGRHQTPLNSDSPGRCPMIGRPVFSRTVFIVARFLVQRYRRHLSPRTAFVCAHRVQHGGHSCSSLFEDRLLNAGTASAFASLGQQLPACRAAKQTLAARGIRRDDNGKIIIPCVPFI